jgi:hypothetical protein
MAAAELKYRIDIYTVAQVQNSRGTLEDSYTLFASVRASRKYLSSSKSLVADRLGEISILSMEFGIRYLPGFSYDHIIEFEGEKYTIIQIENLQRRGGHRIIAKKSNEK